MNNRFLVLLLFFCIGNFGFTQGRFIIQNSAKSDKIKFKLVNSLIVIPVEINGVTLSFIVDTGVSKPIVFNYLNIADSLKIRDAKSIYLKGLGEGPSIEALKSEHNIFKIGDAIKLNQDLYAIFDEDLNFAPRLGMPIHGIIGFDLFKDFVVEINYSKKYIRLTDPESFKYKTCKKCETFSLEFYKNKPYIDVAVEINNQVVPVKLLMDTGGSDDLWLFENDSLGLKIHENHFSDFLGRGLSGSVYGKRSKIKTLNMRSFELKNPNVAFPDTSSIEVAKIIKGRNGSVSGGVLKRFNIIFDYQKAKVTFKKSIYFKSKFSYNKSGIELAHTGVHFVKDAGNRVSRNSDAYNPEDTRNKTKIVLSENYKMSLKPFYSIVELRENSPAYKAGLKLGDVILEINGSQAHHYSLQQLVHKFHDDSGKRIKLKVSRDGETLFFTFKLEDVLK